MDIMEKPPEIPTTNHAENHADTTVPHNFMLTDTTVPDTTLPHNFMLTDTTTADTTVNGVSMPEIDGIPTDDKQSDRPTTRSEYRSSVPAVSCMKCDTEQSDMWHKSAQGIVFCSKCSAETGSTKSLKNKMTCKRINNIHPKKLTQKPNKKYKDSKRKAHYKQPYKEATFSSMHQSYYKGVLYKIGDVFSIRGSDRHYFVCIKSFMEDPHCNQYAVIIWLLPLYPNPESYNPSDFLLGPAEDVPRPMDCLSFISHDPPQGQVTLNELRCYDRMPDIHNSQVGNCRRCDKVPGIVHNHVQNNIDVRSGLDLLLEAMEHDVSATIR